MEANEPNFLSIPFLVLNELWDQVRQSSAILDKLYCP